MLKFAHALFKTGLVYVKIIDLLKLYHVSGVLGDGSSQHWSEVTASSLIGLDSSGNVVEEGNLVKSGVSQSV